MSDIPGGYDAPAPPALPIVPGVEVSGLASAPGEPPSWAGVDLLTGRPVRVRVLSTPAGTVELDAARTHAERMALVRPETVRDHLTRRYVVDLADGTSALVWDTVEGTSLADVLAARGALTAGETVTVLVPLLQIVGDLHAAGSALGGVDPGQLLVTADGRPVLDVMGPVQESADPRLAAADDVRAVGELAWRLLGGHADAGEGRPRRREDVLAQAGAALGPAVADALHRDPMRRPRADELLDELFAARAAEPLGLQGPPAGPSEAPLTRAERRRLSASAAGRAAQRRPITSPPSVAAWVRRRMSPTRPMVPGEWVRPGVFLLVGAFVVAVVALTASRMWPDPSSPPAEAGVRASATTTSGTVAADPVAARRTAMRSSPTAVVQDVATARATALSERRTALLGEAEVPGSAAYRADEQIIATLTANQQRYVGLGFTVRTATLVTLESGRAVVSALVDTTAYDVVSATGSATTHRGASPGRNLTYELTLSSQGWRLVSVGAVQAGVSP